MEEFEIGDTVQLKCGGPAMTVTDECLLTGGLQCAWFNGCIRQQGTFDAAILQVWEPPADDGYND